MLRRIWDQAAFLLILIRLEIHATKQKRECLKRVAGSTGRCNTCIQQRIKKAINTQQPGSSDQQLSSLIATFDSIY